VKTLGAFFLVLLTATPQSLSIGAKGGVPLGDTFLDGGAGSRYNRASYRSSPVPATFGPTVEWTLSRRFALTADALYQRVHYSFDAYSFDLYQLAIHNASGDTAGNSWTIPLQLRYRTRRWPAPFVAAGPVLRHFSGMQQAIDETVQLLPAGNRPASTFATHREGIDARDLKKRWYPGIAASAGYDWSHGRIAITPELRYIRWTANVAPDGLPLRFPPNQVTLMLGVTWRATPDK
jgi:hypothetical protein